MLTIYLLIFMITGCTPRTLGKIALKLEHIFSKSTRSTRSILHVRLSLTDCMVTAETERPRTMRHVRSNSRKEKNDSAFTKSNLRQVFKVWRNSSISFQACHTFWFATQTVKRLSTRYVLSRKAVTQMQMVTNAKKRRYNIDIFNILR